MFMKKAAVLFAAIAAFAGASAMAEVYHAKEGEIVIHYNRADGNYGTEPCTYDTCWGVHAWGDAYDSEGQWTKPTFWKGKDDFGVYYVLKANEDKEMLENAWVNYILHKAQLKDQGGADMSFEVKAGKEIYIVNNDCKTYTKMEEAMAAKASPKNDCKEVVKF